MKRFFAYLFAAVSFLLLEASCVMAGTIIFGGPNSVLASSSVPWTWDGSELAPYRTAITNPASFGPAGVVPTTITTTNLAAVNAVTLAGIDVFVSPWWADADTTAAQSAAINTWFLGGGSLFLLQDDSDHDEIGQTLLLPAIASDGSVSNGTSSLFNGPFGTASNVTQAGNTGALSASNVSATNGTIMATNASGQITAAYWSPGTYAPGAGALLILGDVDMITPNGSVSYQPLDDNGRFALNATALFAAALDPPVTAVPEPASLTLFSIGLAGVAGCGWRRRKQVSATPAV